MFRFRMFAMLGSAAVIAATTAYAGGHGGNSAVKARQAHMQLFQHNLGILGNMAKGETPYDADQAKAVADNLVALTGLSHVGYWTPGTSRDELGEETRALPALWSPDSRAMEFVGDVGKAAMELAAVAGNGQEALGPAVGAVGQACTACHREYRYSEN